MEKFVEEHGLELVGANFFFAENGGMCRKEVEGRGGRSRGIDIVQLCAKAVEAS